jgi:hypothetical protein
VAKFNDVGAREKVLSMGPWNFKQDLITMKTLSDEPCE